MTDIRKSSIKGIFMLFVALLGAGMASCSKTESYSELLREEEKATNAFLAQQRVETQIPADSISFEVGPDAPYYRLDPDGYIYMQVISKGDMNDRVESGDVVYFRFTRRNLKSDYLGMDTSEEGNSDDFMNGMGNPYFVYKNTYLTSTSQWGTGIQWPMKFFGYNCEVNLVLRSYYGFSTDQSMCLPYKLNIRYFKPEY